jgi:hypothetical protein
VHSPHSLTHSLTHSLPPSLTYSLTHSRTLALTHSHTLALSHPLTHSPLTHHSLCAPLTPSLAHSPVMSLQQPTPAVQYCTCPHLSQQLALQATHVLAAAPVPRPGPGPRPGPAVMGVESSGGGPGGMEQARPKKKKKLSEAEAEAEVLRSHSSSSKWVYACVHCSYSGHKDDEHFRDHFSADNGGSGCGSGCGGGHSVVVDVVNRELYCMQCQDYQYHDVFDRLVNHCRPGKDFMHQRRKIPLGIVNMGSTCFMSSVLQLLLSSPALVRFFEISECFVVKCKINEVENSTGKNMLCIFCELQKVFLSTNSPMCPR